MTADGKIATAERTAGSFGSRRDQEHLYALRATVDAVLCGARTVNAGDVDLGPGAVRFRRLRWRRGLAECNLRVVATGSGRVDPGARVFRERCSPLILLTTERVKGGRLRRLRELADAVGVFGSVEIDFRAAFDWLQREWGVRRLLGEGGGELNGALFRAGLVHELHLTVCPRVFGGVTAPTIADGEARGGLADAAGCRLRSTRRVGDELFLVYDVLPPPSA
jgi:riboflavin-specific deaminase-like protein